MKRWWLRWYESKPETFEYHGPWWVSGETCDEPPLRIFVAAVIANTDADAKLVIEHAHDDPGVGIEEWSFCNERPDDWSPFCDRFERAAWMRWPA